MKIYDSLMHHLSKIDWLFHFDSKSTEAYLINGYQTNFTLLVKITAYTAEQTCKYWYLLNHFKIYTTMIFDCEMLLREKFN